ncbi:neuropeptide Y receptor type 4-like [Oculina patagonica]
MFSNNTTVVPGNLTQLTEGVDIIIEPTWFAIVRLTVESIIALAGVIGNFAVCFTVTRHRTLNTVPSNTYIRNVAIADLATLLVSFPLGIVREQFTYWPLGEFTCRYVFPLSDSFFGVSVWSITVIAVDRYRVLAANFSRMADRSLAVPNIICASIWFISFAAISLPLILVFEFQQPPEAHPLCLAVWPKPEYPFVYSIAMSLFTYAIPLFLIFVTYCTIKHELHKSESFHLAMADHNFSRSFKIRQVNLIKMRTKRVMKIMTPVVVVFAITVLPLSVFRVAGLFFFNHPVFQKYSYVMFRICFFFHLFNSACNPLIYSIINKKFRQSLRQMLAWA